MGFSFKKYRELKKELEKKREKRMDFATQKCGCVASALEIGMLKTAQGSLKNQVKLNSYILYDISTPYVFKCLKNWGFSLPA